MQIYLFSVGTLKEPYLRAALSEYEKRISAYATIKVTEISEERISDEEDPAKIGAALEKEGQKLLSL